MMRQSLSNDHGNFFKDFIRHNSLHRHLYWFITGAVIIQFAVFKYFYPFASYIHGDSFYYIEGAAKNLDINLYLIGYSKFLRLFSVFSNSDLTLTLFQYLLIHSSGLFLLFSLFHFYKPHKTSQIILLCFFVFNPLFLYMANLVSSDGLFLAVSMTWFALLLWNVHQPSGRVIIWHAIMLFIAFTVRYNAMIYPFISVGAFFLSNLSFQRKIFSVSPGIILCLLFVIFSSFKYKQLTGFWQYSPFSGWQIANNAMYAYRYVDSAKRKSVDKKFQVLDKMVRQFFDSTKDVNKFPSEAVLASTFYMWSTSTPLYTYRDGLLKDTTVPEFKKWASMGPFYKSYGIHLIKKYPLHYIRYYLWPNANKYYSPPVEFLGQYNSGVNYVTEWAKNWFGYDSYKVETRTKTSRISILDFYPILSGIINIVMICTLLSYLLLKGWRYNKQFSKGVLLGGLVWIFNAVFTIIASSAALRFQSFPILTTFIFTVLLIDWMVRLLSIFKQEGVQLEGIKNDRAPEVVA